MQISSGSAQRSVWLDSLIHAREWLAGTTVMRLADYVSKTKFHNTAVTTLLVCDLTVVGVSSHTEK